MGDKVPSSRVGVADGTDVARRTDPASGVEEIVEFAGDGSERIFSCLHVPPGPVLGGVVVCSPVYADFMANYGREVLVSRRLASRGIAVQRFHYRGTGNSDGEPASLSFPGLVADTGEMATRLAGLTGNDRIAFLGTRLGALVAAAAARARGGAPVVLWEPAAQPRRYFREGFRAEAVRAVKELWPTRPSEAELVAQLQAERNIDILGYSINHDLYHYGQSTSLLDELGPAPGPVLLVQLAEGQALKAEYQAVIDQLSVSATPVEVALTPIAESWWFFHDVKLGCDDLVERTGDWLVARLSGASS